MSHCSSCVDSWAMKCVRKGIVEYCRSRKFPTGAVRYFITEYKVREWLRWRD